MRFLRSAWAGALSLLVLISPSLGLAAGWTVETRTETGQADLKWSLPDGAVFKLTCPSHARGTYSVVISRDLVHDPREEWSTSRAALAQLTIDGKTFVDAIEFAQLPGNGWLTSDLDGKGADLLAALTSGATLQASTSKRGYFNIPLAGVAAKAAEFQAACTGPARRSDEIIYPLGTTGMKRIETFPDDVRRTHSELGELVGFNSAGRQVRGGVAEIWLRKTGTECAGLMLITERYAFDQFERAIEAAQRRTLPGYNTFNEKGRPKDVRLEQRFGDCPGSGRTPVWQILNRENGAALIRLDRGREISAKKLSELLEWSETADLSPDDFDAALAQRIAAPDQDLPAAETSTPKLTEWRIGLGYELDPRSARLGKPLAFQAEGEWHSPTALPDACFSGSGVTKVNQFPVETGEDLTALLQVYALGQPTPIAITCGDERISVLAHIEALRETGEWVILNTASVGMINDLFEKVAMTGLKMSKQEGKTLETGGISVDAIEHDDISWTTKLGIRDFGRSRFGVAEVLVSDSEEAAFYQTLYQRAGFATHIQPAKDDNPDGLETHLFVVLHRLDRGAEPGQFYRVFREMLTIQRLMLEHDIIILESVGGRAKGLSRNPSDDEVIEEILLRSTRGRD